MASSGIMMMVIERPSFTIQMHPVHKVFGILMVLSVIGHLSFNMRMLLTYLRQRGAAVAGGVLVALLVVLYGVVINNELPPENITQLDVDQALNEVKWTLGYVSKTGRLTGASVEDALAPLLKDLPKE